MKKTYISLLILCLGIASTAQNTPDSADVFFGHMKLNEVTVTGVTGKIKMKNSTFPVAVMTSQDLRSAASTNIIDAISHQPGMAQISTGNGISKPVIRGLGYNRIVTLIDGVRQEGQQWGDEHGIEVDGQSIGSVEVFKGPASLIYGSDAMAGVVILNSAPTLAEGTHRGTLSSKFQTNSGLFGYSINAAGNEKGFVWDARYSGKLSHAYKNKYDGYVPGSQFRENAARAMIGLNRRWGHSHLILSLFHQTPSIIEGERDEQTGILEHADGWHLKAYGKSLPFQHVKHYKAISDNSLNLKHGTIKAIVGYQQNRRQEYEESVSDYELYFRLHTLTYDLRYLSEEFNGWRMTGGVGGMWQKSQNLGEESLIPAYNLLDIGTYATASKSLRHWTLNGGLRYDHRHQSFSNRNFNGLTGSIGAVWNAGKQINVRFNIARGFRAPNMSELGSDGVHEGTLRYEIGNPRLKAEYSWQADAGLDFSSKYLSAQLAVFANRIENYIFSKRIDQIVEPGYNTYNYTQGNALLHGLEAGIDFHPIHKVHFANTFSYVYARQLHQPQESKYLPMTPAPHWNAEIKYEINEQGRILSNSYVAVGLDCYARQNHYYKVDDTETVTPGYALVSLSAGTSLMVRKKKIADLYIIADNLFDKAYQNHLSRLKYTDINNATGRMGVYNMGFNISLKAVIYIL